MTQAFTLLARLAPLLALWSCAAPKAEVVQETPVSKSEKPLETAAAPETPGHNLPNDGIRLPDMLGLPGEEEFRSTRPAAPESGGAVISRPPSAE